MPLRGCLLLFRSSTLGRFCQCRSVLPLRSALLPWRAPSTHFGLMTRTWRLYQETWEASWKRAGSVSKPSKKLWRFLNDIVNRRFFLLLLLKLDSIYDILQQKCPHFFKPLNCRSHVSEERRSGMAEHSREKGGWLDENREFWNELISAGKTCLSAQEAQKRIKLPYYVFATVIM